VKPSVYSHESAGERYIEEGCYIRELSNSSEDEALSIAEARLEPGMTTRWHRLQHTTERYVILHGQGRVELGKSLVQDVGPGDVVLIPALCDQRITNTGDDDLLFLAICTPRFQQCNYQDTEDMQQT
jgi:mannose-6-phosphate isomerase-like protein (cupin superfamily)